MSWYVTLEENKDLVLSVVGIQILSKLGDLHKISPWKNSYFKLIKDGRGTGDFNRDMHFTKS